MSDTADGVLDQAAVTEIWSIRDNPQHPHNNPNARGHDEAKLHMRNLYVKAYGDTPILDGVLQSGGDTSPGRQPAPEAPAPEGKSFEERVPGPDSPPPDPILAPAWHDAETRETVTGLAEIAMPPSEVGTWIQYAAEQSSQSSPDPEQTLATLREKWGGEFDVKLAAARLVVERLPPAFAAFLNNYGFGNDLRIVARLAELGLPLQKVRGQIDSILQDPKHPYNHEGHPRHAAALAEVRALYKKVYSDRPA